MYRTSTLARLARLARLVHLVLVAALGALAGAPLACGGSSPPAQAPDPAVTVQAKLQGTWRLVDYRPEVALEPSLQAIAASQVNALTVRFEDGHMIATSGPFHWDRPYVLSDVADPMFKLTANDNGDLYTSECQLSPDGTQITFHATTEPWRGYGTLRRQ